MVHFEFKNSDIKGLIEITPFFAEDERGYLSKPFEKEIFADNGIKLEPFEELQACSKKGVVRGLHFQREHAQDKLVRVVNGAVYDVAVDLREGSATFGEWRGFYLTAENRKLLYVPKGFAHGYLALEENTVFTYLCGNRYDPASDGGILWNDPQLAVEWPLDRVETVILSEKDAALPSLSAFLQTYGALQCEKA